MTNITKPLDIEARELLAKHYEASGTVHYAKRLREGYQDQTQALAAIYELLTRLREAEGRRVITGRNGDNEVGFEFISGDKHLLISLDLEDGLTSYAMKKDGKFVPGEHLMEMPADIVDYLRAASLIEKLEGMG